MIRFSKTFPGVSDCTEIFAGSRPSPSRVSTTPLTPNDVILRPVFASMVCSRLSFENSSRRSDRSLLSQ